MVGVYILPIYKRAGIEIPKNYKCLSLDVMFNNIPLLNRIQPEIEKTLRKNQNGFRTIHSTTS